MYTASITMFTCVNICIPKAKAQFRI